MFTEDQIFVMRRAILRYGFDFQINKAKEELSELHLELDRLMSSHEKTSREAIITEIADVTIMCQQLAMMYGEDKVNEQIEYKLERLSANLFKI